MLYIRLSDLRKTKTTDGALEKNVDYQFEFPRQCIVQKNALSLTQAPMVLEYQAIGWKSSSHDSRAFNKYYPHDGLADYQYYQHDGFANCSNYSHGYTI